MNIYFIVVARCMVLSEVIFDLTFCVDQIWQSPQSSQKHWKSIIGMISGLRLLLIINVRISDGICGVKWGKICNDNWFWLEILIKLCIYCDMSIFTHTHHRSVTLRELFLVSFLILTFLIFYDWLIISSKIIKITKNIQESITIKYKKLQYNSHK